MTRPIWLVVAALGGACGAATDAVEPAPPNPQAATDVVEPVHPNRLPGARPHVATDAVEPARPHHGLPGARPHVASNAISLPSTASCKVEPPIVVELATRPLAADRYELTAIATPTKALDALDLAFELPAGATITKRTDTFGPTRAGESRILVATVTTTARSSELSAVARFPFEGITMARAATAVVGEPRPLPAIRQYTTPDGELVREVRP